MPERDVAGWILRLRDGWGLRDLGAGGADHGNSPVSALPRRRPRLHGRRPVRRPRPPRLKQPPESRSGITPTPHIASPLAGGRRRGLVRSRGRWAAAMSQRCQGCLTGRTMRPEGGARGAAWDPSPGLGDPCSPPSPRRLSQSGRQTTVSTSYWGHDRLGGPAGRVTALFSLRPGRGATSGSLSCRVLRSSDLG